MGLAATATSDLKDISVFIYTVMGLLNTDLVVGNPVHGRQVGAQ